MSPFRNLHSGDLPSGILLCSVSAPCCCRAEAPLLAGDWLGGRADSGRAVGSICIRLPRPLRPLTNDTHHWQGPADMTMRLLGFAKPPFADTIPLPGYRNGPESPSASAGG